MNLLRIGTFLAAFLLFQLELIISKIFLPHFGGSYLVWGACVVFFQGILLAGYIFAHHVVQRYGMIRYRNYHLLLFLLPAFLFLFPLRALPGISIHQNLPMVFDVFWQLLASIGLVFFALSTMAVIAQSWLASSSLPEKRHPYSLYAVSNLGSFAALLTYPFLVEPLFDLNTQLIIWRVLYGALIVLLFLLLRFLDVEASEPATVTDAATVPSFDKIRWLLFSAAPVIAFLAVTNLITYEITPVPLFWVIPLGIYLLSFVLVFKEHPWCPSWITDKFHYITGFGILFFFMTEKRIIPMLLQIVLYYGLLFAICMFSQAKLLSHKPSHKRNLTVFYTYIALGGFFGGIITSWVVPAFSSMMVEFLLCFFVLHLAFFLEDKDHLIGYYRLRMLIYTVGMLILWPLVFTKYHLFGMILIIAAFKFIFQELHHRPKALFMNVAVIFFIAPFLQPYWVHGNPVLTHRNYYGIYRVHQTAERRMLMNGTTLHGVQFRDPARALEATAYYHRDTPLGEIMGSSDLSFKHIGIVGLGSGGIAGWGKKGQAIDYFELDPDVYTIATRSFTFLAKTPARVRCIFGDARLKLNGMPDHTYDLLIIDAFSGDSIPAHLLTIEAIDEYRRVLKEDGIILFHVSNRYLNLIPVVISNARSIGLWGAYKSNELKKDCFSSIWVVVTADRAKQEILQGALGWSLFKGKPMRPWTDAYSTILPVFKLGEVFDTVRYFRPFWWYPIRKVPPLFTGVFLRFFFS